MLTAGSNRLLPWSISCAYCYISWLPIAAQGLGWDTPYYMYQFDHFQLIYFSHAVVSQNLSPYSCACSLSLSVNQPSIKSTKYPNYLSPWSHANIFSPMKEMKTYASLLSLRVHCDSFCRWLVLKDTFVAYIKPETGTVSDVLLMDREFEVKIGLMNTGIRHGMLISNYSR